MSCNSFKTTDFTSRHCWLMIFAIVVVPGTNFNCPLQGPWEWNKLLGIPPPSIVCVERSRLFPTAMMTVFVFFFFKVIFLYVWFVKLCYYNNKSNDIAKIFQNTHPIFIIIFFFKLGFFLSIKWRWRKRICIQQVKSVQRKTGKFCSSTDFILLSNCAHCFRSCFFFFSSSLSHPDSKESVQSRFDTFAN